jgi:ATP-dependent DNA ligase
MSSFIFPMLATRLEDPRRLADARHSAEPKLDGSEGIRTVFEARTRPGSPMVAAAFDLLERDGASVMGEPSTARRKRLERIAVRLDRPRAIRDHPSFAGRAGGGE